MKTFNEINPDLFEKNPDLLQKLSQAYAGRLDNIDVYIGKFSVLIIIFIMWTFERFRLLHEPGLKIF